MNDENITLEEVYKKHLDKKPQKQYNKFFKEINKGIETNSYIGWRIRGKMLKDAVEVPEAKRQEVMDALREGLTIGDVGKKVKLDSEVVSTILYYNITDVKVLRSKSI